jgi:segregation and condensation protein A
VVTFLSLLELTRLGLIRVYQERQERPISEGGQWGVLRIMLKKMEEIDQEGGQ